MEYTGPPPLLVTAIQLLVAVTIIAIAVWRGERARSQRAEALTRARTKRAYLCFLAWGMFVWLAAAIAVISVDWLEVVGILGGIPAGIVAAIGLFHALMVWRERSIQILLLATAILPGAFAAADFLPTAWPVVVAAAYGLGVIAISVQGLRRARSGAAP